VRAASDFLMALQLTGAAKKDSIANLQIRLPVVVIGGGLTAIDTATESLAYYPLQVEKFLARHEILVAERGEAAVFASMNDEERGIALEFLAHAKAIRAERAAAQRESREPNIAGLVNGWGGVTIAYRKRLIDSPYYTLNHEEVLKAPKASRRSPSKSMPTAMRARSRWRASRTDRRSRQPCPRALSLWQRERSPTPCWRARMRRTPSSTANISARSTRKAIPPRRRGSASRLTCAC
jgi:hypothetical protein